MKKTKKYVSGLCAALIVMTLTGCGGKASDNYAIAETTAAMAMSEAGIYGVSADIEMTDQSVANAIGEDSSITENAYRKLIKTVSLDVETEEFDSLLLKLENRVKELNGYIESSNVRGNSRYIENRYSNMTVRIPSAELDSFVSEVSEISNITWKSENVDDITLTYVDIESRKKALEIEQERLLTLLEKAESVEDIITIESRLSEVRYELQSYASQLLVYDNQVEYSTVYLNISEVKRLTPQEEPGMWERITTGFSDNLSGALMLLENLVVDVIIMIPYWGILVIAVVAAILICRGISRAQKKKKNKKQETITIDQDTSEK